MAAIWWLVAALVLGIIEVATVNLIFIMFAIGALAAALSAWLGVTLVWQIVIFCVVSLVLLFGVRPWAKRHLSRTTPNVNTNAQGLVGLAAVALTVVDQHSGRIRLADAEWSARTYPGAAPIPVGASATVASIDGATAVVVAVPSS